MFMDFISVFYVASKYTLICDPPFNSQRQQVMIVLVDQLFILLLVLRETNAALAPLAKEEAYLTYFLSLASLTMSGIQWMDLRLLICLPQGLEG